MQPKARPARVASWREKVQKEAKRLTETERVRKRERETCDPCHDFVCNKLCTIRGAPYELCINSLETETT